MSSTKTAKAQSADKKLQAVVTKPMTIGEKKALLETLQSPSTLQSLRRPEILMDFFTDCLDSGKLSLAIPALGPLFSLITTRNLDYPSFYQRLYSLLDPELLHRHKYRSEFLRHLVTFLDKTNHVPAATIASFIKRLARLSLFAPPPAAIAIIPIVYNILQDHPTCTYMIHRRPYPPYTKSTHNLGVDPFDDAESDPQLTNAIDSSLWELETLQSHYYHSLADVSRILSEQFTKPRYNVDDFLDRGYNTLMETELSRKKRKRKIEGVVVEEDAVEFERTPVVEYRIPRRIFVKDTDGADADEATGMLLDVFSF